MQQGMREVMIMLKKIKNFLEKIKEKILLTLVAISTASVISTPVYAVEGVSNSKL